MKTVLPSYFEILERKITAEDAKDRREICFESFPLRYCVTLYDEIANIVPGEFNDCLSFGRSGASP